MHEGRKKNYLSLLLSECVCWDTVGRLSARKRFVLSRTPKNIEPPMPIHSTLGPIPCSKYKIIVFKHQNRFLAMKLHPTFGSCYFTTQVIQCMDEKSQNPYLQKGTRSFFLNNGLNTVNNSFILVCRSLEEENRNLWMAW